MQRSWAWVYFGANAFTMSEDDLMQCACQDSIEEKNNTD